MKTVADLFENIERRSSKYDTYFYAYEKLFAPYRGKEIVFVEIGVRGGGSLEVWRQYFGPDARIIGIDLNPAVKDELERDGFEVFVGDQADEKFWQDFFNEVGDVDIVLDDGGHANLQTKSTMWYCVGHIKDGGLLVIEDTHVSYMKKFGNPSSDSLISYSKECIDALNARSPRVDLEVADGIDAKSQVHSIQYFESIVALHIDRTLSHEPRRVGFGSTENMATKAPPEDYRYHGKDRKPRKRRLFGR